MAIVGFSFTKMSVEKRELNPKSKINVNNNVQLINIERVPLTLGSTKEDALKMSFSFSAKYEPNYGEVVIEGFFLYVDSANELSGIESAWAKDKKLPKALMNHLLNNVLSKCNVMSLVLSKEVNLPPSIPLPRLEVEDKPSPDRSTVHRPKV